MGISKTGCLHTPGKLAEIACLSTVSRIRYYSSWAKHDHGSLIALMAVHAERSLLLFFYSAVWAAIGHCKYAFDGAIN